MLCVLIVYFYSYYVWSPRKSALLPENIQQNCWIQMSTVEPVCHVDGALPQAFALGKETDQPRSSWASFSLWLELSVKLYLCSICENTIVLSPPCGSFVSLLKKIRSQSSLGVMAAGLIDCAASLWPGASLVFGVQQTMEIISCQPTLAPPGVYNPQKNFCHQLFCAGAKLTG